MPKNEANYMFFMFIFAKFYKKNKKEVLALSNLLRPCYEKQDSFWPNERYLVCSSVLSLKDKSHTFSGLFQWAELIKVINIRVM